MTAYEQYQLRWMIDHGYSIKNLMDELTEYQKDASDEPAATVSDIFADWEKDSGFRGELWVCEQEWRDCEHRAFLFAKRSGVYNTTAKHLFMTQLENKLFKKLIIFADNIEEAKKKAAAVMGLDGIPVKQLDPTEDPQVYDIGG